MNKRMIAICTVALMGMASLVSCNQTVNNQQEKQDSTLQEPQAECVDTVAIQEKEYTQKASDPTIREVLMDGAKTALFYNRMEDCLDIDLKYKGNSYHFSELILTDEAVTKFIQELYYADTDHPGSLKPTDVKSNAKLSDGTKL